MSEVIIRRMKEQDIDEVLKIEESTFAMPWSRKSFEQEITENKCARYLVTEKDGQIVAYGGEWLIIDEGHITNIAVIESERGQGIGKQITQALLQYAANLGVQYLTLEVRKSNIVAQNLYKSLGFVKVGVRKKYYEDNGEDGYLMVCDKLPPMQKDFTEDETVFE